MRYDQCSGNTQLLSPLTRFIVDLISLSSTPLSPSEMVSEVLRAEHDADPGECLIKVDAVLKVLVEAQLIQRVMP